MSKTSKIHAACSVQTNDEDVEDNKTKQISLTLFHYCQKLQRCVCTNYNVDSNTKSSNYSKIRFKGLIYFEL